MEIFSSALIFFLVMDPIGNIPLFLSVLKYTEKTRRKSIIFRECFIAFVVMLVFLFSGKYILALLGVTKTALNISAGIILFLIAVKMVFPISEHDFIGTQPHGEPFIVPLAIPLFAGPSTLSMAIIMTSREPHKIIYFFWALSLAWLLSTFILLASNKIGELIKERGLIAVERLTGLILTAVSAQMFIDGLQEILKIARN